MVRRRHTRKERRCNFRSEDVPCLVQIHGVLVGRSVQTEPGKSFLKKSLASRRQRSVSYVHSQPGTKVLVRLHLHKDHQAECKSVLAAGSISVDKESARTSAPSGMYSTKTTSSAVSRRASNKNCLRHGDSEACPLYTHNPAPRF